MATQSDNDRAAMNEFRSIALVAKAVCSEDEGSTLSLGGATIDLDAMRDVILNADEVSGRLADLRAKWPTPPWAIQTLARSGRLYDCLWNKLRQSNPFSAKQQVLLNNLNRMQQQLNQVYGLNAGQVFQAQIASTQSVLTGLQRMQTYYLTLLEARLVRDYANAALLARRYGFEGFSFSGACERLTVVARTLGDEEMMRILQSMLDPTDPEPDPSKRRRMVYVAGAFADAC